MKKLFLLLIFSLFELACATSVGWPEKEPLPSTFIVSASIPKSWGSQSKYDDRSTIRVTLRNNSDEEVTIVNLDFRDFKFLEIQPNGIKKYLNIEIGELRAPSTNPGMILGPQSQVGFDIEMNRSVNPVKASRSSIILEGKVRFVLGKVVRTTDPRGKPVEDYGSLDGFEYTVLIDIKDGQRLLK